MRGANGARGGRPRKAEAQEDSTLPRFFYIVEDMVRRYRGNVAVGYSFWAALYHEKDYQYALGYCGHHHREPDAAKKCGERMLQKIARGTLPDALCQMSPTYRHLYRSSGTCVYCNAVEHDDSERTNR